MLEIIKIDYPNRWDEVYDIRKKVFVIEQQVPENEEIEFEPESIHYLGFYENKAVATGRYRFTKPSYVKIERVAVLKEYRSLNLGKLLMEHILNDLKNNKEVHHIYLHAQLPVKDFYAKLNFIPEGEIFYEANIPHVKMNYKSEK